MKTQMKLMLLAVLLTLAAASAAYADSGSSNAVVSGAGSFLKMPFTLLQKMGESLPGSKKITSDGDVAVHEVYDSGDIEAYHVNPGGADL